MSWWGRSAIRGGGLVGASDGGKLGCTCLASTGVGDGPDQVWAVWLLYMRYFKLWVWVVGMVRGC